ncbi:MAG: NYN domain-containing protein [Acidimicrobiales bacterium]
MAIKHVIVDGSNIATEGRTAPSLVQLDEAVRAFLEEYGDVALTVVVDATFGHRIEESEHAEFEAGIVNGELVTPPAGAIGRGDAFILQIAAKTDATIFSNDSFQEFHGSYEWLFDEGRLIGGKPVPSVGWVFVPRTPVRGPTSRRATRDAHGRKRSRGPTVSGAANEPMPIPTAPPPQAAVARAASALKKAPSAKAAPDAAPSTGASLDDPTANSPMSDRSATGRARTAKRGDEAAADGTAGSEPSSGRRRRSYSSSSSSKATGFINEAMPYLQFVSAHPIGSTVEAIVDRFSSHGAYAVVGDAQCYIPLKAIADPPPIKAREVLSVGEVRPFVVTAFDAPRRGIDVAVPGVGPEVTVPASAPDVAEGTAAAEELPDQEGPTTAAKAAPTKRATGQKEAATKKAPSKKATAKKVTGKKATATRKVPTAKKTSATGAPGTQEVPATSKAAPTRKAATKKATGEKAAPTRKAATKATAGKATPTRKAATKKGIARTAASGTKSAAKRAEPTKKASTKKAPVAKKAATKKAATKKAPAAKKAASAPRKAPANRAPAGSVVP